MIYLAADHRGFELKEKIKVWLKEWGYEYEDMGAFEFNENDDYPNFISKAAERVSQDPDNSKAIIMGGSGQGEAMVANRYKGVRAAVYYGPSNKYWVWLFLIDVLASLVALLIFRSRHREIIKLSREHNNANVLSLGASFLTHRAAKNAIKLWLETSFPKEERHKRRIAKF